MDLLEIAELLAEHDPATTPQRELANARRWVREDEARCQYDEQLLSNLDDSALYEWKYSEERGMYYPSPRSVAKQTARQVRLAPEYEGQKQICLSREKLEAGEFVRDGQDWLGQEFAFGWAARPRLEEQIEETRKLLLRSVTELRTIEDAIANGDPVPDPLIELLLFACDGLQEPTPSKIDWKAEGF